MPIPSRALSICVTIMFAGIGILQNPDPQSAATLDNKYVRVIVAPPSKAPPTAIGYCSNMDGVPFVRLYIPTEVGASSANASEKLNFQRIHAMYVEPRGFFGCSFTQDATEVFIDLKSVPTKNNFKDDPVDADSSHNQILLEYDRVRALYVHFGPGESGPIADMRACVIVAITDSRAIVTLPNGHTEPRNMKAGDISFLPARREATKNTGTTPLRIIVVELKTKR
jgi:hypothetical protein